MIRIRDIIHPENVLLDIASTSRENGILEVAKTLQSDSRVANWPKFYKQLGERDASGRINLRVGLTVPHTRTSAVTGMVMAFGRLAVPIPQANSAIQFITVIGIPEAMDAEYLRLLGILMRVFRDEKSRRRMAKAEDAAEIINEFASAETRDC
jgi:mannitol/fructose-specific phosphotransferase system IIA component (Ntr-type)